MPNKQAMLVPGTDGINLSGTTLTIAGTTSDVWTVQGMTNVNLNLSHIHLTISTAQGTPAFNGVATAQLPVTSEIKVDVNVN